ncbi:hypothetical protein [Curtobacterium sp. BRB10]|uniref:hypothetical protein n=1 Tax=Curtobacterium sp. BRB10 TaxID=2962579 RepID=UPI0028823B0C|nr:hypothetical protein [Curtobacterium sp. BRB10]MDT0234873.1 hypothetical protein [Curtobacterium sp. BRB10]
MTARDDVYTTVTTLLPAGEGDQPRRSRQIRTRMQALNLWAKEGWRLRDSIDVPAGDVIEVHDTLERTGTNR